MMQEKYPTDKLMILSNIVCNRLDSLLKVLDVSLSHNNHRYFGSCPIHDGDNFSAFSLYPQGYSLPGYWVCRSRQCQKLFKPTILGFVRGVLSNKKCNWNNSKQMIGFDETIKFICDKVVGKSLNEIKVDPEFLSKHKFISDANLFNKIIQDSHKIVRKTALDSLQIPADYYLDRGYSQEILKKYDVGLCETLGKEMYRRVVFPVYDETYRFIVGCTGRSIHPQCIKCSRYHIDGSSCPNSSLEFAKSSKWYENKGFSKKLYLFNFWFAKKHISESGTVILVEGPGDVLRLEEAGIHNSVGIFGTEFSDSQQILLETAGAMNLVLLLDNDEAGQKAKEEIKNKCKRCYRIFEPQIPNKDVGEMSIEQIKILGLNV